MREKSWRVRGWRKYTPATVVVTKEEQPARAAFNGGFDAHITPAAQPRAAEFGDVNRRRGLRREPFLNQKTQRLFARGSHDPLRAGLSSRTSRAVSALSSLAASLAASASRSAAARAIVRLVAAARSVLQCAACRISERRRTSCRAVLRFMTHPPHCTKNLIKHFNSMPESGVAEMVLTK